MTANQPKTLLLGLAIAFFVLSGCSLNGASPSVIVTVALPPALASRNLSAAGFRGGPELVDMVCYGLLIEGAPGVITSSRVGGRSPTCLALPGAFFGPYTYSQLTAGVPITLSATSYTFSLVGFHGVACGSGLADLFGGTSITEKYKIGNPVTADLKTVSTVKIDAGNYVAGAAIDRTPFCPVPPPGCSGYTICDTLTDTDGTNIAAHTEIPQIFGELTHDAGSGHCFLDIAEVAGGFLNLVNRVVLSYPTDCPFNTPIQLRFSYVNNLYTLNYGAFTNQFTYSSPVPPGTQVGFSSYQFGTEFAYPFVDTFAAFF